MKREQREGGGGQIEMNLSVVVPAEAEEHMGLTGAGRKNKMDDPTGRRQPQHHEKGQKVQAEIESVSTQGWSPFPVPDLPERFVAPK